MTEKEYSQAYKQKIIEECDVIDVSGNHCPEMPIHQFERNEETVNLCDKCFKSYSK